MRDLIGVSDASDNYWAWVMQPLAPGEAPRHDSNEFRLTEGGEAQAARHIYYKEIYAALRLIRAMIETRPQPGTRFVVAVDSAPALGALRLMSSPIADVKGRLAELDEELGRLGVTMLVTWVPTAQNPADDLTRETTLRAIPPEFWLSRITAGDPPGWRVPRNVPLETEDKDIEDMWNSRFETPVELSEQSEATVAAVSVVNKGTDIRKLNDKADQKLMHHAELAGRFQQTRCLDWSRRESTRGRWALCVV